MVFTSLLWYYSKKLQFLWKRKTPGWKGFQAWCTNLKEAIAFDRVFFSNEQGRKTVSNAAEKSVLGFGVRLCGEHGEKRKGQSVVVKENNWHWRQREREREEGGRERSRERERESEREGERARESERERERARERERERERERRLGGFRSTKKSTDYSGHDQLNQKLLVLTVSAWFTHNWQN